MARRMWSSMPSMGLSLRRLRLRLRLRLLRRTFLRSSARLFRSCRPVGLRHLRSLRIRRFPTFGARPESVGAGGPPRVQAAFAIADRFAYDLSMTVSARNCRVGVTLPGSLYRIACRLASEQGLTWSEWAARLVESECEAQAGSVELREAGAYLARFSRASAPAKKRC